MAASAQQVESFLVSDLNLPDAPGRGEQTGSHPGVREEGLASISGTVVDISGAVVVGARVTLAPANGTKEQFSMSDGRGEFTFSGLTPGTFRVTVTSKGLETFASNEISVGAGKKFELPLIELPVAPANSEVQVVVTEHEIAHEQLKMAEKQRVLGVIPNFYTSYIWNAAPLSMGQKMELTGRSVADPVAFAAVAIVAGVEQAHNTFPGYGGGPEGYAKRYGAAYADRTIGRVIGSAILPSLLHQDPRYFYRGTGSVLSRAFYAIAAAVMCKNDKGNWEPNYSHVGGNFAAAGISNLYRAKEDRTAGLTIRNGFIITAGNAGQNLVREFISKRLSTNVPGYANGKPVE